MRGAVVVALVSALAALTAVPSHARSGEVAPGSSPAAAAIFERVARLNEVRGARLRGYVSTRRYSVFEPGKEADAELVASMRFVAPSTKTFTTLSTTGVGWIHRRVFGRLMDAEREAAAGADHAGSAITPANYDVRLAGHDTYRGRDCYVLDLLPRRRDKYLISGRAWIDVEDFGIAKIAGDPVRSPSFWVLRAPFVREYQRIDGFWLPLEDETHTQIRFVGEYVLRIAYSDYQISDPASLSQSPGANSLAPPDSAGRPDPAPGPTR